MWENSLAYRSTIQIVMSQTVTTTRSWRQAAVAGLLSGTVASAASSAMLALCGWIERKSMAAPNNGPSQWIWGEPAARAERASWRHTAVGYAVHHVSSIFWAVLHEKTFGARPAERPFTAVIHGLTTAAVANFVDYCVAPRRLQPGFDKHIGRASMFAVYVSFGLGLAAIKINQHMAHRRSS
jgi:hypothetical protein